MSHIIEEYAKNLGVKIAKPIVSKHFWPIPFDNYITICVEPDLPSKKYKYYELVIDMILPYLTQNQIKIVQVGSNKSQKLSNVNAHILEIPFKNAAYIISKSKLHIGIDNVYSHYAGSIDIPIITLFGNVYSNVSKSYWSKNAVNIEAPWKVKPCLNVQDPNDTINKIKPEDIANAIFKQLKSPAKVTLKTEHIGSFFHKKIFEVVPNFFQPIFHLQNQHIFLRPDYGFNQDAFVQWCRFLNSFSIFSDKIIPMDVFAQITDKLKNISYIIDDSIEIPEFHLQQIRKLNIDVSLLVKDEDKLNYYRNKYFDFEVNHYFKSSKKDLGEDVNFNDLFFSSSKTIFNNGIAYPSTYHMKNSENIVDKSLNLTDNEALLEDLAHFYVYRKQ
jgi:hypothetical protein